MIMLSITHLVKANDNLSAADKKILGEQMLQLVNGIRDNDYNYQNKSVDKIIIDFGWSPTFPVPKEYKDLIGKIKNYLDQNSTSEQIINGDNSCLYNFIKWANDNRDQLPIVGATMGKPWWKILVQFAAEIAWEKLKTKLGLTGTFPKLWS